MRLRSLLFVPGDRPDRMRKALRSGADALILDLEDAVSPAAKPKAREQVSAFLKEQRTEVALFVRINPLDSPLAAGDLSAIVPARPDGIVLPKSEGASSVACVSAMAGGDAPTGILPIATETPWAVFGLGTYRDVRTRLVGLTWGAEDLPAAIGATAAREPDGRFTPPYEVVRAFTLFGAHAAGVPAIETVFPEFRDLGGLADYATRARKDGFNGMLAIHPAQVPIINAAFTPSKADIAHARSVVATFDAHPGVGALSLDGRMIDAPHLRLAHAVLAQAGER